jgi:hypothetical protein
LVSESSSEDGVGTATAPTQFSTQKAASSLSRRVGVVLVSVALFFWYDIVGSVVEVRGRPAERGQQVLVRSGATQVHGAGMMHGT